MIIEYSDNFLKEAKKLSKKFKLKKPDLQHAVEEVKLKNDLGVYLGFNLFNVGTQRIWPARAFTLGHLTHNDLASVRIAKRATKSL